jgi:hypothetical protein
MNVTFSTFMLQVITQRQKTLFESGVLFGSDCSQFLKFEFCNANQEILCSHHQLTLEDETTMLFQNIRSCVHWTGGWVDPPSTHWTLGWVDFTAGPEVVVKRERWRFLSIPAFKP